MELAVSTMLDRAAFSPALHRGTTWETPGLGGFQTSSQPVLWLKAFPTASGIPGHRSATIVINLAVIIPTVARVRRVFWLSTFS